MAVRDDFAAGEVLAAADLNDTFAQKLPYSYGTATPTTSDDGFLWYDSNATPPQPKYWDGSAFAPLRGGWREIGGATLSGSATNLQGIFSAAYRAYRVYFDASRSTNAYTSIRMLDGSTPASTAGTYLGQYVQGSGSTASAAAANNAEIRVVEQSNSDIEYGVIDFLFPFLSARTYITGTGRNGGLSVAATHRAFSIIHNSTVVYDGLQFLPSAGTFTGGVVRVYGYEDTP